MPKEIKPDQEQPKNPPRSSADPTPPPNGKPNAPARGGDWIEGDEGSGSAYLSNPEREYQDKP